MTVKLVRDRSPVWSCLPSLPRLQTLQGEMDEKVSPAERLFGDYCYRSLISAEDVVSVTEYSVSHIKLRY